MADDFGGSIAQLFINYATNYVPSVVPGQNFYQVMLFCGNTESTANFVGGEQAVGTKITVTPSAASSILAGALLGYASNFFAHNTGTSLIIVIYDDSTVTSGTFGSAAVTALTAQYNAYKNLAYFKLMTLHDNIHAQVALAMLCEADKLLSKCWIDGNDAQLIVIGSTTSVYALCKAAATNPVIIYHPDATKSPCLTQIGLSLGTLNESGTSVGNSLDYIASDVLVPSGVSGASLSATIMAILKAINVGFYLFVGNGSGRTAVYGGKDIGGTLAAASWIENYIDYVSAVQTAVLITSGSNFRNSSSYACILQILRSNLNLFVPGGRLSNVVISAPAYANLPPSEGDMITIPDAWSAEFNDNLRKVDVQGTLYISAS